MDENSKELESSNSNNFNIFNDMNYSNSNYTEIKSYDIKILDKSYSLKICKEDKNNQIIFLCNEKSNINNINNIGNNDIKNDININKIENNEMEKNKIYYEGKYTLEELISNNKFFNIFDSLDELIKEIIDLLDDNLQENISVNFNNNSYDKLLLKLNFPFLVKKNKEVIIELLCKGINDKNINHYFYNEILSLQKTDKLLDQEIEELKKQNELINYRLFKLENYIQKENINSNNKIEDFFNNAKEKEIDSYLLYKKDDIEFLNNRLLQDKYVPKGKVVKYKLLYRCSKNGENARDFHKFCDNFPQTLTVIKSVKGKIFGGYTEQTWKDDDIKKMGTLKKDNKAFLFSLNKKKIYNNYSDQPAIWCHESYGPCFYGKGNFTIYSKEKLINEKMKTNKAKECTFSIMEKDYELTDGEESFNALEIEVFQILFT